MTAKHICTALLALVLLPTACDEASDGPADTGGPGGKADEADGTANLTAYECQVFGSHSFDGEEAEIEAEGILVELDGPKMCVRPDETLPCQEIDPFGGGGMPWSLSLRTEDDGGERPMILTLQSPTQNAAVGRAYAEPGTAYVGLVIDSGLEALCSRVNG